MQSAVLWKALLDSDACAIIAVESFHSVPHRD